jgi:PTS system nitrogen regulatory IIA component
MDLKIKDVAELLNVSETTIRRWLTDGKIPAYRMNHQYRFSRIEIENWMMKCKIKPELGFSPFADQEITQLEENTTHRGGPQQFSLYRAINNGGVFSEVPGATKEEIIRGTMKLIAPRLALDAEVLSELLLDREKLMPTALNHGVAVPHTRDFLLQGRADTICVVFPQEPLEYGALDGNPVHTLFFLFSTADKKHLHLLAKLAHLSSSEEALALLQQKPDKPKLLEFIREWEANIRQYAEV